MDASANLALLNACLNGLAGCMLVAGGLAIRSQWSNREAIHRRFMFGAVVASCLFLVSYLTRMSLFGSTAFQGIGGVRIFYFVMLISHMILAMATVPLVIRTVFLGIKNRREEHRKLVRFTFPIWLYVSVTGVMVYFFLYHFPG